MQIKFLYHSENSVRPFTYGFRFVVRIGLNFVLSYTPLERFTETLYGTVPFCLRPTFSLLV